MADFVRSTFAIVLAALSVVLSTLITFRIVHQHLRHHFAPVIQRYIIRILFIVPVYSISSFLSLVEKEYSLAFDTIRDCYEAWVIYNFLTLCFYVLGGESSIVAKIGNRQLKRNWIWGTCCLPPINLDSKFLRMCKKGTLQYVIVKPLMTTLTLLLHSQSLYAEGQFRFDRGYPYICFILNISVAVALYLLVMFYMATSDLYGSFQPVLKFVVVKGVIFLSFWQSVMMQIFARFGVIAEVEEDSAEELAIAYQDFIICLEMFIAAVACIYAFPYEQFVKASDFDPRGEDNVRSGHVTAMRNLGSIINVKDVIQDTMHNFSPVYQEYVLQHGEGDEEEKEEESNSAQKKKKANNKRYKTKTFLLSHQRLEWLGKEKKRAKREEVENLVDEAYASEVESGITTGFTIDKEEVYCNVCHKGGTCLCDPVAQAPVTVHGNNKNRGADFDAAFQ